MAHATFLGIAWLLLGIASAGILDQNYAPRCNTVVCSRIRLRPINPARYGGDHRVVAPPAWLVRGGGGDADTTDTTDTADVGGGRAAAPPAADSDTDSASPPGTVPTSPPDERAIMDGLDQSLLQSIAMEEDLHRVLNAVGRIPALRDAVDSRMRITKANAPDVLLAAAAISKFASLEAGEAGGQGGGVSARVVKDRRFEQLIEVIECRHESLGPQAIYQVIEGLARLDYYPKGLLTLLEARALSILDDATDATSTVQDKAWLFYSFGYAQVVFKYDARQVMAATGKALRSPDARLDELDTAALANLVWAVSATRSSGGRDEIDDYDLVTRLTGEVAHKSDLLSVRDAVKTAWSLSSVGHLNTTFLAQAVASLEPRILDGEASLHDLIQLLWVLAKSKFSPPESCITAVTGRLEGVVFPTVGSVGNGKGGPDGDALAPPGDASGTGMSGGELAQVTWALAVFGHRDARNYLVATLEHMSKHPEEPCSADCMARVVWAIAELSRAEPSLTFQWAALLGRLTVSIEAKLHQLPTSVLAQLVRDYSVMHLRPDLLLGHLSKRLLSSSSAVAKLTPREVAMVGHAFAKLGEPSPLLWEKLVKYVGERTEDFELHDLSQVLWAMATVGQPLALRATVRLEDWKLRELNPSDVSRLHWGLARLLPKSPPPIDRGVKNRDGGGGSEGKGCEGEGEDEHGVGKGDGDGDGDGDANGNGNGDGDGDGAGVDAGVGAGVVASAGTNEGEGHIRSEGEGRRADKGEGEMETGGPGEGRSSEGGAGEGEAGDGEAGEGAGSRSREPASYLPLLDSVHADIELKLASFSAQVGLTHGPLRPSTKASYPRTHSLTGTCRHGFFTGPAGG